VNALLEAFFVNETCYVLVRNGTVARFELMLPFTATVSLTVVI